MVHALVKKDGDCLVSAPIFEDMHCCKRRRAGAQAAIGTEMSQVRRY